MRARLVTVTARPSGALAERTDILNVESLRIGRGTDSDICLNGLTVSLHHATLEMRGDGAWIRATEPNTLLVNGRTVRTAHLSEGDRLRIGHVDIEVLPPTDDEDVALRIVPTEPRGNEREALDRRVQRVIERGVFTRRRLSWIAVLGVLSIFLVRPLVSSHQEAWNSGPISNKHAFIQKDCRRCHGAFEAVTNESCVECHFAIDPHTPDDAAVDGLAHARCAECHIEHNGSNLLTNLGEPLCVGCHDAIYRVSPGSRIERATDFGRMHPEFRFAAATVPEEPESEEGEIEMVSIDTPGLAENSGLTFSHLGHVGRRLPMPDGTKQNLACDACHLPGRDGGTMLPLRFDDHCRGCHSLTFDKDLPDREALHGAPVAIRDALRELYADQVLRGAVTDAGAPRGIRLRKPGQRVTQKERPIVLRWVEQRVAAASEHLMRECRHCHEVLPAAADDGQTDVAPTRVRAQWMPRSEFRHDTHGPFACRDCHPAAAVFDPTDAPELPRPAWSRADARPYGLLTPAELAQRRGLAPSESAADILIPGIESCRGCHGGEDAGPTKVASRCGLCHPFHRPDLGVARRNVADGR